MLHPRLMVPTAAALAGVASLLVGGFEATAQQRLTRKAGQIVLLQNGGTVVLTNSYTLSPDIQVMTNGTFSVKGASPRALLEGQILSSDGLLTSTDGSVVPVEDHLAMVRGRPMLIKNGSPEPIKRPMRLEDGTTVQPDGTVTTATGSRTRLLDGQWFRLSGDPIASRDSIKMHNGKVVVQKDGSLLTLTPGRTITMNDGTKVIADGTVVHPDGTREKLKEGQTIQVEGVVRRLR